jgi:hypothetical protein
LIEVALSRNRDSDEVVCPNVIRVERKNAPSECRCLIDSATQKLQGVERRCRIWLQAVRDCRRGD